MRSRWKPKKREESATPCDVPDLKAEESSLCREPLTEAEWLRTVDSLGEELSFLDQDRTGTLARHIASGLSWLDDHMTRYCDLTCPSCEDPCCRGRRVFFNRTDLLYLIALGETMPPGQTRSHPSEPCRYLGPVGCTLSRTVRPYVCVWFLCEPQAKLLEEEPVVFQRQFLQVLRNVRTCRLGLETLYERRFPGTREPSSDA